MLLIAANFVLLAVVWRLSPAFGPWPPLALEAAFVAAFAVVGCLPMRLEFSRHQVTFTVTDAMLVAGLFYLSPVGLGAAATAGELVTSAVHRTQPLKSLFNAANRAGAATAAAAVFATLHPGHRLDGHGAAAALAAAACWATLNILAVAAVVASAERRSFSVILRRSVPTAMVTSLIAAPIGVLATALVRTGAGYALLAVPVLIGLTLNNMAAASHRDEHLRIERLYEATTRTGVLHPAVSAALQAVTDEARMLLTGTAAVCCVRESGLWSGWVSQDRGNRPASDLEVAAALTTCSGAVPHALAHLTGEVSVVVTARTPPGAPVELVLAVLRKPAPRRRRQGLHDTLGAFATQASASVENARLLADLRRALDAELASNRRKDEFVAAVSHELRTPLTVVLATTETLLKLDGRLPPGDRERLLHTSLDQAHRLQRLIDDLLVVAAAEQRTLRCDLAPIDVVTLAAQLTADLITAPHASVRVTAAKGPVESDQERIRQIVGNLVSNAEKYAPGSPIDVVVDEDGTALTIAVVDHGPGIPPGDRERAFDRFVQLDQGASRRQGGTGLGLFLCRELATRLGASLQLDETPGGGCTFVLRVPSRPNAPVAGDQAPALRRRPAALASRPRVLTGKAST